MRKIFVGTLATIVAVQPVAVEASDKVLIQPIQIGTETVRYLKGTPTLDLERERGAVQISPNGPVKDGYLFQVAIYNDGDGPINFGIENFRVEAANQNLSAYSRDDLVRRAENRATWAKIGLALVAGMAAGAAASQRNTYRATTYSPYGTYRTIIRTPSYFGQWQAASILDSAGDGIGSIQYQLDRTREMLGDRIIQMTTVDPGDSYAGSIVIPKLKSGKLPAQFRIVALMNGEEYPFTFQLAQRGTPAPQFNAITQRSNRMARAPSGADIGNVSTAAGRTTRPELPKGTKLVAADVALVPAKTASGFCILAPNSYRGTGSKSRPIVTSAMPRCPEPN